MAETRLQTRLRGERGEQPGGLEGDTWKKLEGAAIHWLSQGVVLR